MIGVGDVSREKSKARGGQRFVISSVGPKNKVLWKADIDPVASVTVPISIGPYAVESLIRGRTVFIRVVGRHKQHSQEIRLPVEAFQEMNSDITLHMNAILMPLVMKLRDEDLVYDKLTKEGMA